MRASGGVVSTASGPTLDLHDTRELAHRLDGARARLERDRGVPGDVLALLAEIEAALADSGPFALGISPSIYLGALQGAGEIRSRLDAADVLTQHHRALQLVRRLRWMFKLLDTRARARDRARGRRLQIAVIVGVVCAGAGVGALVSIVVLDVVFTLGPWIALFAAVHAVRIGRARTLAALAPAKTLLLRLNSTSSSSLLRHRVWVATEHRLFLAERWRATNKVQLVRSVEYSQITAVLCEHAGENEMRLELRLGAERIDLKLGRYEAGALLAILCRRTGLPALYSASHYVAGATGVDAAARRVPAP